MSNRDSLTHDTCSASLNLIVQYYKCADSKRQEEIDYCLLKNLENPLISTVHILSEHDLDFASFPNSGKIIQKVIGQRLTFSKAFQYANCVRNSEFWILSNADIFFDETLHHLAGQRMEKVLYALSRHDIRSDGSASLVPERYAHGCQDAWIFQAPLPLEKISAEFWLGIPGCDNKIAYEFVKAGYFVSNPCKKIVIRHLDLARGANTTEKVSQYFDMAAPEKIRAGVIAPTPYLGELYPTDRLDLAFSKEYAFYFKVLEDSADHMECIAGLRNQICQRDDHISDLNMLVKAQEKLLAETREQIAERDRVLVESQIKITALRKSLSWRITSPLRWVLDHALPKKLRRQILVHQKLSEPQKNSAHLIKLITGCSNTETSLPSPVDIIIPVYNAFALTRKCIETVLSNSHNCRLIIVNDASTDARIKPFLDNIANQKYGTIEVIVRHNECNLGFVKSVNSAVKLTQNHFVILNSDTEVPPDWLRRLFAPLFTEGTSIASTTPFSNAAMMCSFPEPYQENLIFKGLDTNRIDWFFANYGCPKPIQVFSGVGFCMAFNKNVVSQIGMFDEDTFGKGYGEECDWSARALLAGYKNVLIPNLFVYHKHGGSFTKEEKKRFSDENTTKFWQRHSKLLPFARKMDEEDEPRDIRDTLSMLIDLHTFECGKRIAIIDVGSAGGGTQYSSLLSSFIKRQGYALIHFRYDYQSQRLRISYSSLSLIKDFEFDSGAIKALAGILRLLKTDYIFVNGLFGWPNPIGTIQDIRSSGIPYVVFAHDFFIACPSSFLIDATGRFCTIPKDYAVCKRCLKHSSYSGHKDLYGERFDDIAIWRSEFFAFLSEATEVISFSEAAKAYLIQAYPSLENVTINEHAIPNREMLHWKHREWQGKDPMNIAILGNLLHIKGMKIIDQLISDASFKALDVNIVLLGCSPKYVDGYVLKDNKFKVHGAYQRDELDVLLGQYQISTVLIPSIAPETFSYTTSEAMLMGYPVICFDLGAPAERIKKFGCGLVIEDISVKGLISAIDKIVQQPQLVGEFSRNTAKYIPKSETEHFGAILSTILRTQHERKQTVNRIDPLVDLTQHR